MIATLYGPRSGEGAARRYGPVDRVVVLSDVHANVPALEAVLEDVNTIGPDLVVFCGDLTWGSDPEHTLTLVKRLGERAVFVRGNGERAVVDLAGGDREPERARDRWVVAQHLPESIEFVADFAFSAVVDVSGLGPVRFCHGSPRSDTELITPETTHTRFAALSTDINETTLVSGHTHLQFDRAFDATLAGYRSVNPGSVGLPYHDGEPGTAYWAVLGPDVELRQTRYDVQVAVEASARVGDPSAGKIRELLMSPPSVAEVIEHAESRLFSD